MSQRLIPAGEVSFRFFETNAGLAPYLAYEESKYHIHQPNERNHTNEHQSNATKVLATPRAMPMKAFLALICGLALACVAGGQVTSTGGGGGNQSGGGMGRQFTRQIVSKLDKVRNVGAHEEPKSQNPPPKKKKMQAKQPAAAPTGGRQYHYHPTVIQQYPVTTSRQAAGAVTEYGVTDKGAKAKEDDAASPKLQNITAKPQGRQKVGIGAAIGGWANDGAEDAARTSKGQGKPAGGNKIGAKGSPTPRPR